MQPIDWTTQYGPEQVETFQYPAVDQAASFTVWNGGGGESDGPAAQGSGDPARETAEAQVRAEYEKRLVEETRRSFEAGRERGKQEGRREEHEAQKSAHSVADAQRVQQSASLLARFAGERDRYLQAVEREVVELALAIAARILRREAQMDPLLLTGAVRVALGQLSASTEVRLRVPPAELDLWGEAIALLPNLTMKPTLVAGEGMQCGDCVIQTSLGSVDLGLRAQLAEIERGFFDRTGERKGAIAGALQKSAAAGGPADASGDEV